MPPEQLASAPWFSRITTIVTPDATDPGHCSAVRHQISSILLEWWQAHGRRDPQQKPWMYRADTSWPLPNQLLSPYGIWIAEVMLQQTQLQVVLPYWQRWMEAFPTLEALAQANEHDVLLRWQGLGYYSRARRLLAGAQQLIEQIAPLSSTTVSAWPKDLECWMSLPGIGRTTAAGILSSAFNSPLAILDGNVRRVLARLHAHPRSPSRDEGLFWQWSELLIEADPARARDLNQAPMDLGATVCTPRSPNCGACPWREQCAAYAAGDVEHYPVKDTPRAVPFQVIGVGVVLNDAGEVLIDQRLNEGLLGGLWEFPGGKQEPDEAIEDTISRELREELLIEVSVAEELITVEHAYSHKKLRFVVHLCQWQTGEPQPLASQQVRWVRPESLTDYPFPAANAKIIAALLKHLPRMS